MLVILQTTHLSVQKQNTCTRRCFCARRFAARISPEVSLVARSPCILFSKLGDDHILQRCVGNMSNRIGEEPGAGLGSPESRQSSGSNSSTSAEGYSGQWAHLWTDEHRANFPQGMQLPSTRHFDSQKLRQDARKTQTETYLPLLNGFLAFVTEFKPWTDFDQNAYAAKHRWEDFVQSKVGRLPRLFVSYSDIALSKLMRSHPKNEADVVPIVCSSVGAAVEACRSMSRSTVQCVENHSVHIKEGPSGETIPYDRKFQMDCVCLHHGSVLIYVEIKKPLRPFVNCPPEDEEDRSNMSAEEMASSLNKDFLRVGHDISPGEAPKWYLVYICQILTGLLHSSTRTAAITNHCETVFFCGQLSDGRLSVLTSGVYTCDGRHKSSVTSQHGFLALLGDLTTKRHSIADNIPIYSSIKRFQSDDSASGSFAVGSSSQHPGTSSSKHYTPPKETSKQKKSKRSGRECILEKDELHFRLAPWWNPSWVLEKPDIIFSMLVQHRGSVHNDGFAGNVRLGVFAGHFVAIKYWSGISASGLDALMHEIEILEYIWKHHRQLMGTAMPWLVAVRKKPRTYTTIVTEYVGKQLDMELDKSGCVTAHVGGQVVPSKEVPRLLQAVETCVQEVHKSGIAHKDIASRSIRAEKVVKGTRVYWRAWLIDFGSATLSATESNKREDLESVRHVFDGLT